jgi:hypothetical protein
MHFSFPKVCHKSDPRFDHPNYILQVLLIKKLVEFSPPRCGYLVLGSKRSRHHYQTPLLTDPTPLSGIPTLQNQGLFSYSSRICTRPITQSSQNKFYYSSSSLFTTSFQFMLFFGVCVKHRNCFLPVATVKKKSTYVDARPVVSMLQKPTARCAHFAGRLTEDAHLRRQLPTNISPTRK